MKPFHTIAVPHQDILDGNLSMDVFAADLWQVYKEEGPEEYKDAETFFKKTYLTEGLTNLLNIVKKRIEGKGGDPVIQLHTPFGGGKTHSLIALYHKAKEWDVNSFVFVGDELNPKDKIIWEELERQLTGKIDKLKGETVPSSQQLKELLKDHQPLILLIDELVEYLIPSRGIKIEKTTLDSQILAFIKRLSQVVSKQLEKTVLLVTSPSKTQYSERDQILFNLLVERLGRLEKSYTPVEEYEISNIVRKRLFSNIDENKIKDVIFDVVDYFKKEDILPFGTEATEYRERFRSSYPFLPDVINCLYKRWGSFPTFQRTRGVLRFLSLVIYSLKQENIGYITLGDFDLEEQELRRELIKHIGNEYDSIIAADITAPDAGSKEVDKSLGESYKGLKVGTRSSTTIFLYSFTSSGEKGANIKEIKRSVSYPSEPSSIVSEAVSLLKDEKLFYVGEQNGKVFFKNTPNLNKIIVNKMENVEEKEILNLEKQNLISMINGKKFKVYIWPEQNSDIDDNKKLKLVILRRNDTEFINEILENKGTLPRVYRNTLFFLLPIKGKIPDLHSSIKRKIALERVKKDDSIELKDQKKKDIKDSIKQEKDKIETKIKETYRLIIVPAKNKLEEVDLGIPTYGDTTGITSEVYEKLKSEGNIIDKMVPLVVKEKYLKGKDYVSTKNIFNNSVKTLGENRLTDESVLKDAIKAGVEDGLFGLGVKEEDKVEPIYWKKKCSVGLGDTEYLVDPDICKEFFKKKKEGEEEEVGEEEKEEDETEEEIIDVIGGGKEPGGEETEEGETEEERVIKETISKVDIPSFIVPKGKVSDLMGLMNYIQSKFDKLKIKIDASEGEIEKTQYEDNIKEALRQMGIKLK